MVWRILLKAALRSFPTAAAALLALLLTGPLPGAEPLHVRIDQMIDQASLGATAPLADEAYLRRLYLDLTGTTPPAAAARAFLDDPAPDKRAVALDRLLDSPEYVRHMAGVFDLMLMERRGEKQVKADEWHKYLWDSVAANKPWNQLAAEMLAADGTDEKIRAATAFYFYRDGEPNLLTRDVGRIFFGMDLQCCQCHDHPLLADYFQTDYYGIYAFLSRGFLFTDKNKKVFYAEKAEGDVKFTSVFTKAQGQTLPRLPGSFEIDEPTFPAGEEYQVKPADKVRPVPKYSRRTRLAELATDGSNQAFNRNIANRLWAHMMGRGLVDPVDLHHEENPPAHPELLDVLANEMVAMKFDVKAFLRELALTKTYQRSLHLPDELAAPAQAAAAQLAALTETRDQLQAAFDQAFAAAEEARQQLDEAKQAAAPLAEQHGKAHAAVAEAKKKADEAAQKLAAAQKLFDTKQAAAQAVAAAAAKIKQAADKLPDEKEIVQAAATFAGRAEKLTQEAAAAEKTSNDLKPPAEQTAAALAEADKALAAAAEQLAATRQKVAGTRTAAAAADQQLRLRQTSAAQADARLQTAKQLVELAPLLAAARSSREAVQTVSSRLADARGQLEQAKAQLPKLEADAAAAQKASDEAAALLAASQQQMTDKQEAVTVVAAAAAEAEAASGKLPDDAELKQAAQAVKARSEKLTAELAELKKTVDERQQTAKSAVERLTAARQQVETTKAKLPQLEEMTTRLAAELQALESDHAAKQAQADEGKLELVEPFSRRFFTSPLAPLTPEQMGWSVMQAAGVVDQQRAAALAEVDKKLPIDPQKPDDPARLAERARAVEQFVYDKLKGNVNQFVKLFGHASGQPQTDFFATVDQALFFANAGTLQSWLNPGGGNLTDRLNKLAEPAAIAEELYISVLTRRPTPEEVADVTDYLASRPAEEKVPALKEMAWALITSAEFRFRR